MQPKAVPRRGYPGQRSLDWGYPDQGYPDHGYPVKVQAKARYSKLFLIFMLSLYIAIAIILNYLKTSHSKHQKLALWTKAQSLVLFKI